tara:strand:+ start:33 stop:473 length:441 start_codon:yes stop_codon:yes gene_type:complete
MNFKLLLIWINVIFILWILLLYIVNIEKIHNIKETYVNNNESNALNYQIDELTKNYNSIGELQDQIDTEGRKLSILADKSYMLNKVTYIFKYITIISILLLILMICVYVLDFSYLSESNETVKKQVSSFVNSAKTAVQRNSMKKLI